LGLGRGKKRKGGVNMPISEARTPLVLLGGKAGLRRTKPGGRGVVAPPEADSAGIRLSNPIGRKAIIKDRMTSWGREKKKKRGASRRLSAKAIDLTRERKRVSSRHEKKKNALRESSPLGRRTV